MNSSNKVIRNKNRVGLHTSIAGGASQSIERAKALDATTLQIFSHSPRQWNKTAISDEEARRFIELGDEYDVKPAFIHASYLINLASLTESVIDKSIDLLSYELKNADQLGVDYVVLHTGSAQGDDQNNARDRASRSLLKAVDRGDFKAKVILENTSGKKGDITSTIQSLADIIERCNTARIGGICLDTCHAFAAGYDIRSADGVDMLLNEISEYIGLENIKLIHANDSKGAVGSGLDRHEHIGEGQIGIEGFRHFLLDRRVSEVPIVLETPKKEEDDDKRNLKTINDILDSAV